MDELRFTAPRVKYPSSYRRDLPYLYNEIMVFSENLLACKIGETEKFMRWIIDSKLFNSYFIFAVPY